MCLGCFVYTQIYFSALEIDSHTVCIIANNENVVDTISRSNGDSVLNSINLLHLTNFPAIKSDCHHGDDNFSNNNDNMFLINQVQQGVSNGCAVSICLEKVIFK